MLADKNLFFPQITLPPAEADFVVERYEQASVIIEYGSGGSTIIGAECANLELLMSVESDAEWSANLAHTVATLYPDQNIKMFHADIGPTKAWGYPIDKTHRNLFPNYPQSIWRQNFFRDPDLVLIDGRFRVGCFYSVMMNTTRPVTVLWDDYTDRTGYHVVEKYFSPQETIGRMVRFEVIPKQYSHQEIAQFNAAMTLPA